MQKIKNTKVVKKNKQLLKLQSNRQGKYITFNM